MKGKWLMVLFFVVIVILAAIGIGAGFAGGAPKLPDVERYRSIRTKIASPILPRDLQQSCRFQGSRFELKNRQRCVVCVRGRGWMTRSAKLRVDDISPGIALGPIDDRGEIDTSAFGGECTRLAGERRPVLSLQPTCLGKGSVDGTKCQNDTPADLRVDREGGLFAIRCFSSSGCRVSLVSK